MQRCPAPGCSSTIPTRLVMCGEHWRQVPKKLRERIAVALSNGRILELRQLVRDAREALRR